MRFNYSTNRRRGHNSSLTMIFSRLNLNGFLETFSTERLGPCIRAGFFFASADYAPSPGGGLAARDKSQFIADMRQ
jgi:hypothetical protein